MTLLFQKTLVLETATDRRCCQVFCAATNTTYDLAVIDRKDGYLCFCSRTDPLGTIVCPILYRTLEEASQEASLHVINALKE